MLARLANVARGRGMAPQALLGHFGRERLLEGEDDLLTSNYVLVETFALVQARLGTAAARALAEEVVPALEVRWMDADLHAQAVAALLAAGRRKLSLVDCSSFAVMGSLGLRRAFAFDGRFRERGYEAV
ncbi:MAG: PIN domain-containing protein [Planctomycetaceae bacterium]|nr:PIN domain-containing protein [Planctomycetaceae bacterium]